MDTEPRSAKLLTSLYHRDFWAWTQAQADLLRQGAWGDLDVPNLIEELESLGRQERQELRNRLGVLLGHLLKWDLQPDQRSKSWRATVREQRRRIADLLSDSPSLRPYLPEALPKAYADGVDLVVRETPLTDADLPDLCPYALAQILDPDFWPGPLDTP